MNKVVRILLLSLVLLVALPTTAFAQPEMAPGCPVGFHMHNVMDQDNHAGNMHQHVGTAADQNGDSLICVKHAGLDGKIHVHIDNSIPIH